MQDCEKLAKRFSTSTATLGLLLLSEDLKGLLQLLVSGSELGM